MRKVSIAEMSDPALAHIHNEVVTLRDDQTAAQALESFRTRNITDKIAYLYVLDAEERLVGVVPVRRLLGSAPEAHISDLMISPVHSVTDSATLLEACEVLLNHRLLALPVLDSEERLRGVIDLSQFTDEVITNTQQQMDNAFQLVGVHVALGRRVSAWASFKDRFPWLLCNIASGTACALIAGRFELLLSEVVVLAMFMTVVLALGESVSMQSMTITLQGLMGQQGGWLHTLRAVRKEFTTSVLLGLGCGTIIGLIAYLWRGGEVVGLVIGLSILASIVFACFIGVAIPATIKILRINPQVAAGPIVLASADMATLFFYFTIAGWLLKPAA